MEVLTVAAIMWVLIIALLQSCRYYITVCCGSTPASAAGLHVSFRSLTYSRLESHGQHGCTRSSCRHTLAPQERRRVASMPGGCRACHGHSPLPQVHVPPGPPVACCYGTPAGQDCLHAPGQGPGGRGPASPVSGAASVAPQGRTAGGAGRCVQDGVLSCVYASLLTPAAAGPVNSMLGGIGWALQFWLFPDGVKHSRSSWPIVNLWATVQSALTATRMQRSHRSWASCLTGQLLHPAHRGIIWDPQQLRQVCGDTLFRHVAASLVRLQAVAGAPVLQGSDQAVIYTWTVERLHRWAVRPWLGVADP